ATLFRRTHIAAAGLLGVGAGLLVPTRVSTYCHRLPFEVPEVKARLLENRLGGIAPAAPVLVAGGTAEQVIPYPQAVRLAEEWKALGADVTMRTLKGREHIGGAMAFAGPAMRFLSERLTEQADAPALQRGA
ncbi:lipase family protein, partial [Nocardia tengchongensis]|uniref:lipase family protein n=1 Tax=Nocardia tengchongensis TaxID=2055889 RepID=UPI00367B0D97